MRYASVKEGVYRIVNRRSGKALTDVEGSVLQFTVNNIEGILERVKACVENVCDIECN